MAWGYTQSPVSKVKKASVGTQTSKGPGFLLVLVSICTGFFVFSVTSEIMGPPSAQEDKGAMIELESPVPFGEEKQRSLHTDIQWKAPRDIRRGWKYNDFKKGRKDSHIQRGVWERFGKMLTPEEQAKEPAD